MQGPSDSPPEKQKETYSASYLAMEAAQRKTQTPEPVRRRSPSRIKKVLLVCLIAGVLAYSLRARLVSWMEGIPTMAPLVESLREKWTSWETNFSAMRDEGKPGGGETSFSMGQGFGTVPPDDGSDSYRVVVPPEETPAR
jgi:hypothetical protein